MLKKICPIITSLLVGSHLVSTVNAETTTIGSCSKNSTTKQNASEFNIIPQVASLKINNGYFTLSADSKIIVAKELWSGAKFLTKYLENASFLPSTKVVTKEIATQNLNKNEIAFILDKNIPKEGYTLDIKPANIIIKASSAKGAFYAVQTIRQMVADPTLLEKTSTDKNVESIKLKACSIKDQPRFEYRGFMIDSARQFIEVDDLKKMIDLMALYKLNKFHWHLTDDQGWRLEIKKYPRLTQHGAFRKNTLISDHKITIEKGITENLKWTNEPYGNFYSQAEAKDIVKYAAERFIDVIPEIDVPGHAVAAISSYPYLSCEGKPIDVWSIWGISKDLYCAGKDSSFDFIQNVLAETMEIFPSKIIHIGGDEAKKDKWKKCPLCQKRMKENNLKNVHELQTYFITRVAKYVQSKGRNVIGWDEILEGGLAKDTMIMSWRGSKGGIEAAKKGHNVVMSPYTHVYFDYYQSKNRKNEPMAYGGFLPLSKVYEFDPTANLDANSAKFVKGGQANIWREYIRTNDYLQYMTFPRLMAAAECVWTPKEEKDYQNFTNKLEQHYKRFDALNVNYRRHDKK
ncbi:beta-N-acetylhexosaminidase [Lentisphaerota bacterium WC36G]|nr:beta-N-acetylhexosaminidase [Lentisphaerae bacterium WC36]